MPVKRLPCLLIALFLNAGTIPSTWADGPADNLPGEVRPIPPLGIEISAEDRGALQKGLEALQKKIEEIRKVQAKHPRLEELLPDVEIHHKAVDWALRYNEFFKPTEVQAAHEQLAEGTRRAEAFLKGDAPWTRQKGLVVRAYRSRIDGSVQPYGMIVPESYEGSPSRLDFWIHGRGEKLSELSFIDERSKRAGQIQPRDTLVLHPYGRYCCANKFAGEIDLFEALEHARRSYAVDPDRIVVRGFSMGGAAVWQFGAHYPGDWCAVTPGAGFSETPEFLGFFQAEDVRGFPWYQQKLWRLYNATDYAANFRHVPTIAYSGEIDKQKQAADVMEREMRKEGLQLTHIIGPETAHKIHPDSLAEIESRLEQITALGRERVPRSVQFTTWTLRYPRLAWVRLDRLEAHWERARIDARLGDDPQSLSVRTENVAAFTLDFPAGHCPLDPATAPRLVIDGNELQAPAPPWSDRSFRLSLEKRDGQWQVANPAVASAPLAKVPGLQGPIDDAFMDAFVFVRPSGPALHESVGKWVDSELERAVHEWRRQFRGDVLQVQDTELEDSVIAQHNLVLWGDPSSNAVLRRLLDRLPIEWNADHLKANGQTYPASQHLPVLIFPNPLNPQRYVVLNSGFTYREYDYLNNARQVPKLPDWAVIDLSVAPNALQPGKIADAGFFDENWAWKPAP